jgi:hypothetical protein
MKRMILIVALFLGISVIGLLSAPNGQAQAGSDESKIQQGFRIAPVHLSVHGKNHALVGLGSYLVNAVGGCNDCHTCPSYATGHNPFAGGDGQINGDNYLAGGVPFGPFITSRNLTPDGSGKPAGLTFDEFLHALRTGEDPDQPGDLLQVMPWPIFRNMTDRDILAIYTYLESIPPAEPGDCSGAGQ